MTEIRFFERIRGARTAAPATTGENSPRGAKDREADGEAGAHKRPAYGSMPSRPAASAHEQRRTGGGGSRRPGRGDGRGAASGSGSGGDRGRGNALAPACVVSVGRRHSRSAAAAGPSPPPPPAAAAVAAAVAAAAPEAVGSAQRGKSHASPVGEAPAAGMIGCVPETPQSLRQHATSVSARGREVCWASHRSTLREDRLCRGAPAALYGHGRGSLGMRGRRAMPCIAPQARVTPPLRAGRGRRASVAMRRTKTENTAEPYAIKAAEREVRPEPRSTRDSHVEGFPSVVSYRGRNTMSPQLLLLCEL